jgi:biopolymer transport protein ExbD
MKVRPDLKSDHAIPTSSMSDIAFLLIIFFMVTAVFSATKGLAMKLPEEPKGPQPDGDPAVLIEVRPQGLRVDCREMALDEILPYLQPILVANPRKPVILHTAGEAIYRRMIEVYDLLGTTRDADSPWPFEVQDIFVPTRRDLEAYVEQFGANPLTQHCP